MARYNFIVSNKRKRCQLIAVPMANPSESPLRKGAGTASAVGYAAGNLGKNMLWTSFESFLLFYFVTVRGFPAWLAGSVLATALVWDGLADMTVGYLADRFGRRRMLASLILLGTPLAAGGFWLTFAAPLGTNPEAIILAYLVCRVGYTLCDIGHNTLLVRVAITSREASVVSGFRLMFSALGSGIVGMAAVRLFGTARNGAGDEVFGSYAAIASLTYCVTLLGAVFATWHLPSHRGQGAGRADRALLQSLLSNHAYLLVLAIVALQAAFLPSFNRSLLFFAQAMELPRDWPGHALSVIALSQSLSLPFWMAIAQKQSGQAILILSHVLAVIAMCLVAWTVKAPTGWLGLVAFGVAQGGMNMAIWALLATSIRNAARHNQPTEALPVGLFLAVLKCGAAAGNGILAWAVSPSNAGVSLMEISLGLPMLGSLAIMSVLAFGISRNVRVGEQGS